MKNPRFLNYFDVLSYKHLNNEYLKNHIDRVAKNIYQKILYSIQACDFTAAIAVLYKS